jgi:hypothetical protein
MNSEVKALAHSNNAACLTWTNNSARMMLNNRYSLDGCIILKSSSKRRKIRDQTLNYVCYEYARYCILDFDTIYL